IGKAIAEALAAEGARVAITARTGSEVEQVADQLRKAGHDAIAITADVTNPQDVDRAVIDVAAKFGTIHVLVNNAGGVGSFAPFDQLSDRDWLSVFELNVMSAVRVTRAVLPYMQRQKWGRIINISSESATQPDAAMPHYNASKAALNNLTKSLSKAYARDGILANTVSPAFIVTPLLEGFMSTTAQQRGISREQAIADFMSENRPHIEL